MTTSSGSISPLIGRILISCIFMLSGFFKFVTFSQTVDFAAAKHIPLPGVAIACAALVELLGGLGVLAGFQTRIMAWLLFLYLIPTTLLFHNFWAFHGIEQQDNMAHFMKNVAIMGGLLILAGSGPGSYSVDSARAKTP
jgi:putative oxidoreductase